MQKIAALILFILFTVTSYCQKQRYDEIYLKNGDVARGTIMQQTPGKPIRIKMFDNKLFVFYPDEIEKIVIKKRGYFGLELGLSIPAGAYADNHPGIATTGFLVNLVNFGYLFHDHIGICGTWFGKIKRINGSSDNYRIMTGMFSGLLISFPVTDKTEWDFRPMAGALWEGTLNSTPDPSFAIDMGTGVRFNVSKRVTLTVNIDYSIAKVSKTSSINLITVKGGVAFRL